MGRDDHNDPRKRGPQRPPRPSSDGPVDLFSEDDLDAFLGQAPVAPEAAEPPPLEEPPSVADSGFAAEEPTGEIDLADIEEAHDLESLPAAGEDLDFDAALNTPVPTMPGAAAPPPDLSAQHPALAAFSPQPTPPPPVEAPPARRPHAAPPAAAAHATPQPSPAYAAPAPAAPQPPPAPATPQPPPAYAAPAPAAPRGRAPAPRAPEPPAFDDVVPEAPEERTFLTDHGLFRSEAQRLARTRDWQALCAMTSAALDGARWAQVPEARAGLLLDLASIYRDRLNDRGAAGDAFARLAKEDPANREAIAFLGDAYAERGAWQALHDLYANAVEATWDPNQRLDFTRQAVGIARERLDDAALAIADWERLWRLGEAPEITYPELTRAYRGAGRWDALAQFLADRASRLAGPERIVALREVAEVYLTGLRDQEKAAAVLEELLSARADDPIALLSLARVLARRQDWDALDRLGGRSLERLPKPVVLDFRRLVADAFWQAGRLEQAVAAYERVLELDPKDKDALAAKQEFLTRTEKFDALLSFIVARAEQAAKVDEKAELFAKAAGLAEKQLDDPARAIELWEKRIALGQADAKPYQALVDLYETIGDLAGVARALEGLLTQTKTPSERIELLRRLGEHFAHRLGDDARAEACWKEILALSPTDIPTREELIALHRRRGNFEALDSALTRQIWIAPDDEKAVVLARMAAQNIDQNIADTNRAVDAWFRVLDYAPTDAAALESLARHFETQQRPRDLIGALEVLLRVAPETSAQIETAFRIASLWERESARLAALGSYERVLRWDPVSGKALASLVRLCEGGEVGKAQVALEVASAFVGTPAARVQLLRQAESLIDKGDPLGRCFWLARVLWLSGSDPKVLGEVVHEAEAAKAWPDLGAFYVRLAAAAEGPARLAHYRALAKLAEEKLNDPARAYLALQAVGLASGAHGEVLQQLERLSQATGRHEDYLAVLEAQAAAATSVDARREVIRARARICETKINDAERAFQEQRRLLDLDPQDQDARHELHRLAEKQGLWRQLDAVYGELWDRATTAADRIDIARARHAIRRDHLKDPVAALDQLLAIYRLDPLAPGILDELLGAAEQQNAWARVLPTVEAAQRAPGEAAVPADLVRTAALYEEKVGDRERALELYGEAFVLGRDAALPPILERLAEATGRWERLAQMLRLAAARAPQAPLTLELYRRITAIYEQKLGAPHRAIDIHRRILGVKPDELPSLEVMIEWHRKREEWRDLRDRLRQWIEYAPKSEPREQRWLEIARLSQQKLKDPEEALAAYAEVLDQNAQNAEAAQGLSALTADITDPQLELRRMRVELARAPKEARPERLLAIARLIEETLEDKPAAIETLRLLVTEAGPAGPAFEPLTRLYRETGDWASLAQLLEDRAGAETEAKARLERLDEALAVCHEHLAGGPFERHERLYRKILADRPLDRDARLRLARLLRQAGRFADLAAVLRDGIAVAPDADERHELRRELARVLDLALGGSGEAEQVLRDQLAEQPQNESALLALAGIVARRQDLTAYLDLRVKHAKLLPGPQAALVYCHLAEVCDENPPLQPRVVQFYREARTLDPENVPAMEALKAVGRRLKNWRAQAALLPEPGEAQLPWSERSSRLRWRGDQVREVDPGEALSWYWRAVAVDPDNVEAWEAIAAHAEATGDLTAGFNARRAALHAYERRTPPAPERLREHAELIHKVGVSARRAGDPAAARRLSRRAHDRVPEYAPAALVVADERAEAGDLAAAFALYDGALADAASLNDDEKLHATFQRGLLSRQLGRHEQAIADLRAVLRLRPLHAEALTALAAELAGDGRVAAAIQHHLQSLLVVDEPEHRGRLYRELGLLWEDQLGNLEEAGVCYDLALQSGIRDRELMLRALAHYRRTGQAERALQVVEGLIPTTEDPRELAELWVARGDTYAEKPETQETATEAYDMALSYDPGCRPALDGLARVLEARGDWDQLLQILEARIDNGPTEEKVDALGRMARICAEQLGDAVRAERYLRQLVDLEPSRAVLEQLLGLYGDAPARAADRRVVLGRLCAFGPPWMRRVIDLGKLLLDHAERRWAWCLLSPLVNVSPPPAEVKQLLMELRKEFEKADNIAALSAQAAEAARHPDDHPELTAVLGELGALVPGFGCATPEDTGGNGIAKIGENTALGKTFDHIRGLLGTPEAGLLRAQELPAGVMVVNSDPPKAVLKTEFLQLLGNAELAYVFAYVLELMRPGHRVVAAYPEAQWPLVVAGLMAGLGFGDAPPEAQPLCELIRTQIDDAKRAAWAERLAFLKGVPPQALGARYAFGMAETARRLGTIAAADLRLVIRVFSRLYEEVPKPKTVGRVEEIDEYLAEVPALQRLLAFAASPEFGAIVSR
jgi:tetratricopeptide (TPR) repeat protein